MFLFQGLNNSVILLHCKSTDCFTNWFQAAMQNRHDARVGGCSCGPEKFLAARELELLRSEYVIGEGKQATKALHPLNTQSHDTSPLSTSQSLLRLNITSHSQHPLNNPLLNHSINYQQLHPSCLAETTRRPRCTTRAPKTTS